MIWDISVALSYPFPSKQVFTSGKFEVPALPLTQILVDQPRLQIVTEPIWNLNHGSLK